MKKKFLLLPLMVLILNSCHRSTDSKKAGHTGLDMPEATDISELKQTDVAPTMESRLPQHRNVIYAPTLLFAWQKLHTTLGPITIANAAAPQSLKDISQSTSYTNALHEGEYQVTADVDQGDKTINVRAAFNLAMAFEPKLQPDDSSFVFMGEKVKSFGMFRYDYAIKENLNIIYYKDDDHFIFMLLPKGGKDEIIFVKGMLQAATFQDVLAAITSFTVLGNSEKNKKDDSWRFEIREDDQFCIPVIAFNIEKNFDEMTEQNISTAKGIYVLEKVYQRNGFVLNEEGAKVQSESEFQAAPAEAAPPDPDAPVIPDKHFFLNKPFYIVMRHKGQQNPYFMVQVNDRELMETVAK